MIADLLGDATPLQPTSPPHSATGSDVIIDDVIDYPAQSAAIIIGNSRKFEHRTDHRFGSELDLACHRFDGTPPPAGLALFPTAETFSSSRSSVVNPGGLIHDREPSSGCFRETGRILSGGTGDEGLREMMVARQSLNPPSCGYVTPLHWHAVIRRALHAAGQTNIPPAHDA